MSISVDIENISKFSDLSKNKDKKRLQKMFTDLEIDYCFEKINLSQHLTGRFPAKEDIMKVCNSISEKMLYLNDIEVKNDETGIPLVNIKNNFATTMNILLSISHNNNAIAFAVILNKNEDFHN